MIIAEALLDGTGRLAAAGITSARLDCELLLAHVLKQSRVFVLAHGEETLRSEQTMIFQQLIGRRAAREPLVHLTGSREFYGLELRVTPNVLTPRVETEQMVDWAIKYTPRNGRIIDIGTGSGAIAIAIAKHRPDLTVTATEVSPTALEVAAANAHRHEVAVNFIESDLWETVDGQFDTVVTNLPYLRDDASTELMEEVKHEPAVALFGGRDGLDLYRRFLSSINDHLETDGYLFTECDPWQHEDLINEAAKYGLTPVEQGYFILGFKQK